MLKKIACVSFVACITLLTIACGNDVKDACEHINDVCASQSGFTKSDCSKSEDEYDKLSDSDKDKADKIADCINDADTCDAATKCALSGG